MQNECIAGSAARPVSPTDGSADAPDPPLLRLFGKLPIELVGEHFSGLPLHCLSRGFRSLFHVRFGRGIDRWRIDPAKHVHDMDSWVSFMDMADIPISSKISGRRKWGKRKREESASEKAELDNTRYFDNWLRIYGVINTSNIGWLNKKSETASQDSMIRYCETEFHRSVAKRFAKAGDIEALDKLVARTKNKFVGIGLSVFIDDVCEAAITADHVEILQHFDVKPSINFAVLATESGATRTLEYMIDNYPYRDEMERRVLSVITPAIMQEYESGGRRLNVWSNDWLCYEGNVDLIIWLIKIGRTTWRDAMRHLLMHAFRNVDVTLGRIRQAIAAGCPVVRTDYPMPYCYEDLSELLDAFITLTGVSPPQAFIRECMVQGRVKAVQVLWEREIYPSYDTVISFMKCVNLDTLKWFHSKRMMVKRYHAIDHCLPRIMVCDDVETFEWMLCYKYFVQGPNLATMALQYGAKKIHTIVTTLGYIGSLHEVIETFPMTGSPSRLSYTVKWMFESVTKKPVDMAELERVIAALSSLDSFTLTESHKLAAKEGVEMYCQWMVDSGMDVPEARSKCKLFGIKPRNVKNKGADAYAECIKRRLTNVG